MVPVACLTARNIQWPIQWTQASVFVLVINIAMALAGCSSSPVKHEQLSNLPPLQLPDRTLTVQEVAALTPTPDLLAVDDEMREFVQRYTSGVSSQRQRLMMLHRAVTGAGALDLQYDALAEGTAIEVFHRGSANCLSYSNLFVALAREAGLNATYQSLDVRPQWTRQGERVMVRLHVNIMVKLPGRNQQYMVDIDPLPTRDITGSRELSDVEAEALYHNNLAMDALSNDDLERAWRHAVRALQLSADDAHLWVNLGAIYRVAGQFRAAENSYLYALKLDRWERSAMNNLVVLYSLEGREQERQKWSSRVARYRETNPYFHAWLGDTAADSGDWRTALEHYEQALDLSPDDSNLLYAVGLIYYQLDQYQQASGYIERAIERATLRSEIDLYEMQLQAVQQLQLTDT